MIRILSLKSGSNLPYSDIFENACKSTPVLVLVVSKCTVSLSLTVKSVALAVACNDADNFLMASFNDVAFLINHHQYLLDKYHQNQDLNQQ